MCFWSHTSKAFHQKLYTPTTICCISSSLVASRQTKIKKHNISEKFYIFMIAHLKRKHAVTSWGLGVRGAKLRLGGQVESWGGQLTPSAPPKWRPCLWPKLGWLVDVAGMLPYYLPDTWSERVNSLTLLFCVSKTGDVKWVKGMRFHDE